MTGLRTYLDHSATTPLHPDVRAAMEPFLGAGFGNPSSIHAEGRAARDALAEARRQVARFAGARPSEVTFTSGATEGANAAIVGVALERPGAHVVISAVEHPAVATTCERLAARGAIALHVVPVDASGRLDPDAVAAGVRPDTALVCVMAVNNEIGNRYDVAAIAALARRRAPAVRILVDAVQLAGKAALARDALDADLLLLSAHKLRGPKGAGALIRRRGLPDLPPLLFGGPQEGGLRAGTENVPAIVGFGAAAALPVDAAALDALGRRLATGLRAALPDLVEHGDPETRLPAIFNFRVPGVEAESLLLHLDLEGVAASSGSACASGTLAPSRVLTALGLSAVAAWESVRLSLGAASTRADVDRALEIIPRVVSHLRRPR